MTATQPNQHAWRRDRELLEFETQDNDERLPLASFMNDVILPASNSRGAQVLRSGATTACAGRLAAWSITVSLPVQPDAHAIVETIVAVSGNHAYLATYARPSTSKPRADAERAIRTLCLR